MIRRLSRTPARRRPGGDIDRGESPRPRRAGRSVSFSASSRPSSSKTCEANGVERVEIRAAVEVDGDERLTGLRAGAKMRPHRAGPAGLPARTARTILRASRRRCSSPSTAGSTPPSAKINAGLCRCALAFDFAGVRRARSPTRHRRSYPPRRGRGCDASTPRHDNAADSPFARGRVRCAIGPSGTGVSRARRSATRANTAGRCNNTSTRPIRTGPLAPPSVVSRASQIPPQTPRSPARAVHRFAAGGTTRTRNAPGPPSPSPPVRRAVRRGSSVPPPAPTPPPPRDLHCRPRPRTRRIRRLSRGGLHRNVVSPSRSSRSCRTMSCRSVSSSAPSR